ESREGVVSLVSENISVGEEKDARSARGLAAQIPTALKELPGDLKCDERFTRSCGECEQNALPFLRDSLQYSIDGDVLVVATLEISTLVFEGHGSEAVAPSILIGKCEIPKLIRRWVVRLFALFAGL